MIAPFNFVVPVAGTVLSAIFLGENILELKYAVALALVCAGIWWVNKPGTTSGNRHSRPGKLPGREALTDANKAAVRLAGKQHLLAAAGIDSQPVTTPLAF